MEKMEKIKSQKVKFEYTPDDALNKAVQEYQYLYVCYLDGVEIVKCEGAKIDVSKLKELRAFDENSELHITKVGGELLGRTRTDGVGEETKCFDELQLIWGKPQGFDGKNTKLSEDRGICLSLPIEVKEGERAFVKVRSYVRNDKFEFDDYRFVKLEVEENAEA